MARLLESQGAGNYSASARAQARQRLDDAEARVRRHQAAIDGVDPAALVEAMNDAQAERAAARAALDATPENSALTAAHVHAMIDSHGDVGAALNDARPASLTRLYEQLRLELRYDPHERAVEVTMRPRVGNECVRGGT